MSTRLAQRRSAAEIRCAATQSSASDRIADQARCRRGRDDSCDSHGWGFGVSIVAKREDVAGSAGRFGWYGGLGTSWYADPHEDVVGILTTQRAWTSPSPPPVCQDFWTSAYQAIDD